MGGDIEELTLTMTAANESDAAELAELTTQLRQRLLQLEVESVEVVRSSEVPTEAKPGELIVLGTLAVQLAPHVLPPLVAFLTGWLKNRPVHDLDMTMGGDTIKLTGVSREDQQRALQAFIEKHATG